jgi:hypothetical protein
MSAPFRFLFAPLAFVLGAAVAAPLLAQTLPAPWMPQSLSGLQYARYARAEGDGTASTILGMKQVCTCTPADELALIMPVLQKMPSAVVHVNANAQACGEPAQTLLVTGIANPTTHTQNMEITFFRRGDSLYTLEYVFPYPAPRPDVQQTLLLLCPPASVQK